MPVDPRTLQSGTRLHWRELPVRVEQVTRFWTAAGKLLGGVVWIDGRSRARGPIELRKFCRTAKKPKKGTP